MTNPDQTVGTNAGFDGRTTPNAMNDILGAFSRGRISGWNCTPKNGMTIQLGGDGTTRDVAIAEDNAGNRLTINNRTATPVEITLAGAPATGNRIDSIVAYIANPPTGAGATSVDFPDAVGIIAVSGTAAGTPSAPNEAAIRDGITADGASGASAYYVVLANITVGQGVTTIGSGAIAAGAFAQISTDIVDPTPADGSITTAKLANLAVTTGKIAAKAVSNAKIDFSTLRFGRGGTTPNTSQNYSAFEIGTYTVQEAGIYFMAADGYINVAGQKDRSIAIRKNGTDLKKNMTFNGSRHTLSITHSASLAAGDVISFWILSNAADFTPQPTPSFTIFKIGE